MTHATPGHAEHRERSCYVLELSILPSPAWGWTPTGRRRAGRAELFVYNRLVFIRRCLEHALIGAPSAVRIETLHATLAGQAFTLWIVEEGRVLRGIDLRRHIGVRVGAAAPLWLGDAAAREEVRQALLAPSDRVAFDIDWDAIAQSTPALQGEPLHPGESVELQADEEVLAGFDSYLEITEGLVYGYEDLESGRKMPPGFVDPDPPRGRT